MSDALLIKGMQFQTQIEKGESESRIIRESVTRKKETLFALKSNSKARHTFSAQNINPI